MAIPEVFTLTTRILYDLWRRVVYLRWGSLSWLHSVLLKLCFELLALSYRLIFLFLQLLDILQYFNQIVNILSDLVDICHSSALNAKQVFLKR